MKLPSLQQLEASIGGRPKNAGATDTKVRLSIYVSRPESTQIKALARETDQSVSQIVRTLIRQKFTPE
jgi:hypothetical protein